MENDSVLITYQTGISNQRNNSSSGEKLKIYKNGKIVLDLYKNVFDWNINKDDFKSGQIDTIISKEEMKSIKIKIDGILINKYKNIKGIDPPDYSKRSSIIIIKNNQKYEDSIKTTGKFNDKLIKLIEEINSIKNKYRLEENVILNSN